MHKISGHALAHPLYGITATREQEAALAHTLPPHTLMARAATAAATLAQAIAPHARSIWVACGPGNNGGDGLLTAALLAPWLATKGGTLTVTWCGNEQHMPTDARWALEQARNAGVCFTGGPPQHCDLTIDALLGIGAKPRAASPGDREQSLLERLLQSFRQVGDLLLCLDVPSDLHAETGELSIAANTIKTSARAIFCLTFLTLKPGLFTGYGRDAAGEVWYDDLTAGSAHVERGVPLARLTAAPCAHVATGFMGAAAPNLGVPRNRHVGHATHKGDFGDVWVLGGQGMSTDGHAMTGAALLAARAALHAGAGRVFVVPLGNAVPVSVDMVCPELMFRHEQTLDATSLSEGAWVCGCGGGQAVVRHVPRLLQHARVLVLDADALNAIAGDEALQQLLQQRAARHMVTVLTPHPLEAARLLHMSTAEVQRDRLSAAAKLVTRFGCVCVLKGSGSIIAGPGLVSAINPTGNAKLSTAGTGDVLAGLLGAGLAHQFARRKQAPPTQGPESENPLPWDVVFETTCNAVWTHGHIADSWPTDRHLSASQLVHAIAG